MIGLTYPPQRDLKTGLGGRAEGACLTAMVTKRLVLPRSSESPQQTVPVLLLGKHLSA